MSEMALTAEHLIVVGRGRLLADMSTSDFIARNSRAHTRVRSPQADQLAAALTARGAQVAADRRLPEVDGMSTDQVGDVAAGEGLTVHELFTQRSSLEEAFMELTRDSVEYHAEVPVDAGSTGGTDPGRRPDGELRAR